MQLPVKVTVIPDGVAVVGGASNEIRPPLGMAPEHEERRANAAVSQRVEHQRRRLGIGAVVEGQRD